jgi:hypothetical protein
MNAETPREGERSKAAEAAVSPHSNDLFFVLSLRLCVSAFNLFSWRFFLGVLASWRSFVVD